MKSVYKKRIVITGSSGLLGKYFSKKFKKKYLIYKYPYRIENKKRFAKWISRKNFEYFIHFAAISKKNPAELNRINSIASINIIKLLSKKNSLKYFLFISTSHVYRYSKTKISEKQKIKPINKYGLSKKRVEDFIIQNKEILKFKIGIARIFNITGPKQREGYFVPDMYKLIKKKNFIDNVNSYRDFIHIDDVMDSINILIKKKFDRIINICSGQKISLIKVCKTINSIYFKKNLVFGKKGEEDLYGDNKLLKSLGKRKFKNIYQIIKSFKK